MKFVYAHFPINYNVTDGPTGKNTILEIRNFIGEKLTRRITMQKGCVVERTANKDEIAITGNDLDMVSISAAQVHFLRAFLDFCYCHLTVVQVQQSSIAKNRDLRKFLDGIYVSERLVLGE
jgi:large subunit ribosomal protein L9e